MTDLMPRTDTPPRVVGEIAPGTPIYLIPVNAWLPWAQRTAGVAMGSWIAATTTLFLTGPLWWAVATAISTTLLFAFVIAGHELREKHPNQFKRVP